MTTAVLYNCTTVPLLHNCTTVPLYHCTTAALYNSTARQLWRNCVEENLSKNWPSLLLSKFCFILWSCSPNICLSFFLNNKVLFFLPSNKNYLLAFTSLPEIMARENVPFCLKSWPMTMAGQYLYVAWKHGDGWSVFVSEPASSWNPSKECPWFHRYPDAVKNNPQICRNTKQIQNLRQET